MTVHARTKPSLIAQFGRFAKPEYKAVSRMTGFALTLCDQPASEALSAVLAARLTEAERAFLAHATLMSLDPRERDIVRGLTP